MKPNQPINSTDRMKAKFAHLTREERDEIARANGANTMGVRGDMYRVRERASNSCVAASESHMGRLDSIAELGRIKASMLEPVKYSDSNAIFIDDNVSTGSSHSAEFTQDIDKAMGIEPQAAWPLIAELYDSHGWSAWYDLGVICVVVLGIGVMYLSGINSY